MRFADLFQYSEILLHAAASHNNGMLLTETDFAELLEMVVNDDGPDIVEKALREMEEFRMNENEPKEAKVIGLHATQKEET